MNNGFGRDSPEGVVGELPGSSPHLVKSINA